MFPVPEASVPAVEICSERSEAGITANTHAHEMMIPSAIHVHVHVHACMYSINYFTFLSERDPVILQKDDLQTISNLRIIIHNYKQDIM
jgi:hypothetical protein